MKSKTMLAVLTALLFVVLGVAFWLTRQIKPIVPEGPFPGEPVLAGFDPARVTGLTVVGAGVTSVVSRKDGQWVSDAMFGHPADSGRVSDQLDALAQMKVVQVLRDETMPADAYGLQPSEAVRVLLRGADGNVMTDISFGTRQAGERISSLAVESGGQYVRVAGGPVILADTLGSLSAGWGADWIEKDVVNLPMGSITEVRVTAGADAYAMKVLTNGGYVVEGMRPDEYVDGGVAVRLMRALSPLTVDAVANPETPAAELGFESPGAYEALTGDGTSYRVEIGAAAPRGGRYARVVESHSPGAAPKWVYIIGDYALQNMLVPRAELVQGVGSPQHECCGHEHHD